MPRPKGSKNKFSSYASDEKILKYQKEIEELQVKLKEKKTELKNLKAAKTKAEKQKLYDAIETSDMSVEELLELIRGKKGNSSEDETENADIEEQATDNQEDSQESIDQDIIE